MSCVTVTGRAVPPEVTVTIAHARLIVSLCTVQPVESVDPRRPMIAWSGTLPGGGQASQGLPARPVPRRFCMQEAPEAVEPMPIGPGELDRIQRRCPIVVALPGSIM